MPAPSNPADGTSPRYGRLPVLTPLSEALQWLVERATWWSNQPKNTRPLMVEVEKSLGRNLAFNLTSPTSIPSFRRAMMDGLAINYHQAKSSSVWTVQQTAGRSGPQAVTTGAALPPECDTVVPIEHLIHADRPGTTVTRLNPGLKVYLLENARFDFQQHVAQIGEDVQQGQIIAPTGKPVGAHQMGLLAATGFQHVPCKPRPSVSIVITGNELLPDHPHRILDANGPSLKALSQRDAGPVTSFCYLGDDPQALQKVMTEFTADVLIVTGGTSVGPTDHSVEVLKQVGSVHFHGIRIKPGKPVAIGTCGSTTVFLLPGNPVACYFTYDLLVRPYLQLCQSLSPFWPYAPLIGQLSEDVESSLGRCDYLRVKLRDNQVVPISSGRASNLSTLGLADGFIIIPPETDRLEAGQAIEAFRF